jgi:hypothetical protein
MLLDIQGTVIACAEVIRHLKERLTSLERRVASIDDKLKARGGKKRPTRSVRYARAPRRGAWVHPRRAGAESCR